MVWTLRTPDKEADTGFSRPYGGEIEENTPNADSAGLNVLAGVHGYSGVMDSLGDAVN